MKRFLLTLMLMCGLASGAGEDLTRTGGFKNGRWWLTLASDLKPAFLLGFTEGLGWAVTSSPTPKLTEVQASVISRLTYGEVEEALDMFYKEPTNALIAIPSALQYITRKAEGASEAEVKQMEAGFRRVSAKYQEK